MSMLDSLPPPPGAMSLQERDSRWMVTSSGVGIEKRAMRTWAATSEIAVLEDQLDGVQRSTQCLSSTNKFTLPCEGREWGGKPRGSICTLFGKKMGILRTPL